MSQSVDQQHTRTAWTDDGDQRHKNRDQAHPETAERSMTNQIEA